MRERERERELKYPDCIIILYSCIWLAYCLVVRRDTLFEKLGVLVGHEEERQVGIAKNHCRVRGEEIGKGRHTYNVHVDH